MTEKFLLDKVLDKTKEVMCIEKIDDIKILIDTGDKFPDGITLKDALILMTCPIKDDA